MTEQFIYAITQKMSPLLNNLQLEVLRKTLENELRGKRIVGQSTPTYDPGANEFYMEKFLTSKRIEGCSGKTLLYYQRTLENVLRKIGKSVKCVTTDDLRSYLTDYHAGSGVCKVTIDNVRRILSTFFSWLEDEDYILKSPARRIHKVKTMVMVRNTFSDEDIELMRDACQNVRDRVIIDMLASTGMRVGEMAGLKRSDVDLSERECVVLGKGDKQRTVYFDARTKIHLQAYLEARKDDSDALFVPIKGSARPLGIGGIEHVVRQLGGKVGLTKAHPHKFRRTLATGAIDKGMPIEQVQQLLGHKRIDTTLMYAMVKQANVKASYRRCIS